MSPETRILLANCAASLLLLLLFLLLVVTSAALFLLWRGVRQVRREVPGLLARVEAHTGQARRATHGAASRALVPQVKIASQWIGLKVAVRALVSGAQPTQRPTPPERNEHG